MVLMSVWIRPLKDKDILGVWVQGDAEESNL